MNFESIAHNYVANAFFEQNGFICAGSTKTFGNMSYRRDHDGSAKSNEMTFLKALGIDSASSTLAILNATHSNNIALVEKPEGPNSRMVLTPNQPAVVKLKRGKGIDGNYGKGVDAAISQSKDIYLGLLAADCAPVFFCAPKAHTFAIVHAGALGVFTELVVQTVYCMREWCSVDPVDVYCYIGPCAMGKHYSLADANILQTLVGHLDINTANSFDLSSAIRGQLVDVGIPPSHIQASEFCTVRDARLFYSNGRQHSLFNKISEGRQLFLIGRA